MQKSRNELKKSGIFDSKSLNKIEREGKPCIFRCGLKKNLTMYLFDFFTYRELSDICNTNIFFHNCFIDYELSNWKMEMTNIKEIFHLDIKDPEKEIDETLSASVKNNRIYPVKDCEGNFLRIDKEGINLISLVYYDPDMQEQLNKYTENENNLNHNGFNFEALNFMDLEYELENEDIIHHNLNTPWYSLYSKYSYIPGNIIYLEKTSPIDFGFSFNHVMKDDYKFYLHHYMEDMRNSKLRLQIIINGQKVYEIYPFPNKEVLEKSSIKNQNNELNDVYICDINKHMFEVVKNSLKSSINSNSNIDLKNSFKSDKSTEYNSLLSNKSIQSVNSLKSQNSLKSFDFNNWDQKDYNVRIRFVNTHLFWKAGWYVDGGKLVRNLYKIEK